MNSLRITRPLILLIALAFVLFAGGTIPYFLFYILLLTLLLPLGHLLINLWGLKGSVNIPSESLFSGESIDIEYKVKNHSILPITYLEIESDISRQLTGLESSKITLSLDKKQSYSSKETITLKRRGYYEIGEISVTLRDVFGLYSFKKKISSSTSLLVYPEIINLSTFKITASQQLGDLLMKDSSFRDKSRINTIREYREGDHVKDFHWKLTAKRDTPIIKDFENRGDTHAVIFIDNEGRLFQDDVDRRLEDKAVDAALSIASYCLSQNVSVSLETQNYQNHIVVEGQQKSDLKPFLETLAKFNCNGTHDFQSLFIPRVANYAKGTTVVIITPNLDKIMGAQGIHLKMKNQNPLFVVLTDMAHNTGHVDQVIEKRLKQEGILVYNVDYKTSVKDILEVYHD